MSEAQKLARYFAEPDLSDESTIEIMNDAWTIARNAGFYIEGSR